MKFTATEFQGLWIIDPERHSDPRGYFCETFRADLFEQATGMRPDFVQDNESESVRGVVRGLHYQAGTYAQAKLVRAVSGEILDVALDLRRHSPTFGRHFAMRLSAENGRQLFIPRGFAHGFAVLSPTARFLYKTDNYYAPQAERTILFNDPALAISWPFTEGDMLLSPKDLAGKLFVEAETF